MQNLFKHPSVYLMLSFTLIFLLSSIKILPLLPVGIFYFGLFFIALGLILLAICFHSYFQNQLAYPVDEPVGLIVKGIYHYSRNPKYLALLLLLIGNSLLTLNPITLLIPYFYFQVSNKWIIPSEERKLIRVFGMDYLDYKDHVRRWI